MTGGALQWPGVTRSCPTGVLPGYGFPENMTWESQGRGAATVPAPAGAAAAASPLASGSGDPAVAELAASIRGFLADSSSGAERLAAAIALASER